MLNGIREILENRGISQLHAYSRKSRDIDEEGLKKHHDIIEALAEELGFPVKFYEEVDSSETLNRPQLNQLRKDIQSKKVRCLIVYRMDRLSRKVTDTERLVKEFAFNDLILIEAHREKIVDYNELLGIKLEAMMSDLYQEQAKIVLTAGRQKAVALYGNHIGEAPLGYTYDKETKKLIPNNDAIIVQEIFKMYLEGYSGNSIAVKLNTKGIRTRKGALFTGKAIIDIIQNDKYIGIQTYGKREWYKDGNGRKMSKERPKEEWIVYQDAHEAIIDEDTFKKAQKVLEANKRRPSGAIQRKYSLSTVAMCGMCGKTLPVMVRQYKTKTSVNIRACNKIDFATGHKCSNGGIHGDIVRDYIKQQLWKVVRPVVLQMKKEWAKDKKEILKIGEDKELKDLEKQKIQLSKQMNNLIDLQMNLGVQDHLVIKMKQVEAQLKIVQDRLENLQGSDSDNELYWVENFLKEAEDLIGFPLNWEGMNEEDKNIFIKKYIENVIVLNHEIVGVKYSEEVESLLQLRPTEPMSLAN